MAVDPPRDMLREIAQHRAVRSITALIPVVVERSTGKPSSIARIRA